MRLETVHYVEQAAIWPPQGRHILAQYDDKTIIVYQAYSRPIGSFAAQHGYFGGDFSFSRMSWIKTNFLWMMYRSGWGTKANQEVTLAIRIRRGFFDSLLEQAVPSTYDEDLYADTVQWRRAIASSNVRLQWDPDHAPSSAALQRRAIQLGMRDQMLKEYARDAVVEIEDISEFVEAQRPYAGPEHYPKLMIPQERCYIPNNPAVIERLKLSRSNP